MPSIVGAIAKKAGIYFGIATITIAVVIDLVAIIIMTKYLRNVEK